MKLTTIWLYIMVIAVIFDIFFTIPRPCKKGPRKGNCWDSGGSMGLSLLTDLCPMSDLGLKDLFKVFAEDTYRNRCMDHPL